MKFKLLPFALACGLFWGLAFFLITWWFIAFEGTKNDPLVIGLVYRGYHISAAGSLFGLLWGFVDGFVGGAIFVWLHNMMIDKLVR